MRPGLCSISAEQVRGRQETRAEVRLGLRKRADFVIGRTGCGVGVASRFQAGLIWHALHTPHGC